MLLLNEKLPKPEKQKKQEKKTNGNKHLSDLIQSHPKSNRTRTNDIITRPNNNNFIWIPHLIFPFQL